MKTTIDAKYMANVDLSGSCWLWTGTKSARGYGRTYDASQKKTRYAHRMMFEVMHGYTPTEILHSCDVPSCVNPDHMRGGTHVENMRDMAAKGRSATAKITADDVRHIRSAYVPGRSGSSGELQKMYGISRHTVRQIALGETWKDVK